MLSDAKELCGMRKFQQISRYPGHGTFDGCVYLVLGAANASVSNEIMRRR